MTAGILVLAGGTAYASSTENETADDRSTRQQRPVDFGRDIKPIFARRCFPCHGPDANEGGLRLHEHEPALAELDSGEHAIVPGKTAESVLLIRIAAEDEYERMPPEGKPLSKREINLLRRWIESGAEWEKHWAFVPPQPQEPPKIENESWGRNPIDAFILQRLQQAGLSPSQPADKTEVLRRVYFSLTGLPPTPSQVDAFLANPASDAYEDVVDELLDSPRYGEHWARHWLDLVRFAETNSFERDNPKPNAWRYRDYVIRSLNSDKPYDQFIREQLAGDELDEVTTDSIIATGYYRLGIWDDEPADPLQAEFDELDSILTTTSQVFLGLTINCARCHDHKIDPIPQKDYYRLLAFFRDLRPYGTRRDQTSFNQTDISPPELRGQYARLESQMRHLEDDMRVIEQRGIVKMSAEDQRKTETPQRKKLLEKQLQKYLDESDWSEYAPLKERYTALEEELKQLPPRHTALSVAKCLPQPPQMHVMARGNPHAPGDAVAPGYPTIFGAPDPTIKEVPEDAPTARRRIVLANWIASPDNMLTTRVLVNRVWQFHFGRGLVRAPNNFGQLSAPPTHPELLDWLAAEFIRQGWSLKQLHRMILTSNTYRMSSRGNAAGLEEDPENNLFWRFDMRRLSAEEIRDSIHAVSGQLNLDMYGPGIYPTISEEVLAGQSRPGSGWGTSTPEEQARRSVYIHVKRSLITPLLANFDFPETDTSCEARFSTTQPAQALGMLNGNFVHAQAKEFANRLRKEAGENHHNQIALALRLTTCRKPTEEEIDQGIALLTQLTEKRGLSDEQALEYYCLVALNLNEFLYLD